MDEPYTYKAEAEFLVECLREYRVEMFLLILMFVIPVISISTMAIVSSLVCYLVCFFYHPIKERKNSEY